VTLLGIWLAGGAGAVCRYLADDLIGGRVAGRFPWATLAVNVSGCLALGAVAGLVVRQGLGAGPAAIIGSGFLGGYTTFSTYAYETLRLIQEGEELRGFANAVGSLAVGAGAAALGLYLTGR
jgi:CrcB protein